LVLVSGEAGIGKTTLVSALAARAEACGARVLWGHAYDLSVTPPYGPWVEILWQLPGGTDGLRQPPSFAYDAQSPSGIGSQDALFAAVAEYFKEVARRKPLLLLLDELHWADQGSLDFLRFLARQLSPHRILLVAT